MNQVVTLKATAKAFKTIDATSIKATRPGDHILVTMPHYWGRGTTFREASANLTLSGGSPGIYWRIHSVHPDTLVDQLGFIEYPSDHLPVLIAESNPAN